jgi:hypothetical protein
MRMTICVVRVDSLVQAVRAELRRALGAIQKLVLLCEPNFRLQASNFKLSDNLRYAGPYKRGMRG